MCPSVQPIKTNQTNCTGQHAGLIVQMLFLYLRTLCKIFQQCKTRCFMNMWSNWWVFNRLYSCLAFTPRSKWVHRSALPPLFRRLIASWKVQQNPSTLCKTPINFSKSVGWVFKMSQKHKELFFIKPRRMMCQDVFMCACVCVCALHPCYCCEVAHCLCFDWWQKSAISVYPVSRAVSWVCWSMRVAQSVFCKDHKMLKWRSISETASSSRLPVLISPRCHSVG